MRFKTEIEVVSMDEHEYVVRLLQTSLESANQQLRNLEDTAAEQTDWKRQVDDLLAEREQAFETVKALDIERSSLKVALQKASGIIEQLKTENEELRIKLDGLPTYD